MANEIPEFAVLSPGVREAVALLQGENAALRGRVAELEAKLAGGWTREGLWIKTIMGKKQMENDLRVAEEQLGCEVLSPAGVRAARRLINYTAELRAYVAEQIEREAVYVKRVAELQAVLAGVMAALPSNRDDDFYKMCRYKTASEALKFLKELAQKALAGKEGV